MDDNIYELEVCWQDRNYNVQPNSFCVMCIGNVEEDTEHLFFWVSLYPCMLE
jgi:hypothetical protein